LSLAVYGFPPIKPVSEGSRCGLIHQPNDLEAGNTSRVFGVTSTSTIARASPASTPAQLGYTDMDKLVFEYLANRELV
jgi:hypothetical protein